MSMTLTTPPTATPTPMSADLRRDGVIGLWGRIMHRDPESYATWLETRDLTIIAATLLRLNERQLNRLGMSRATLTLDVEALALRAEQDRAMVCDILRIVGQDETSTPDRQTSVAAQAIAAE